LTSTTLKNELKNVYYIENYKSNFKEERAAAMSTEMLCKSERIFRILLVTSQL